MKFLIALVFALLSSVSAFAQATLEAGVGAHFNNVVGQNDVFGYLAGAYKIAGKLTVGAAVYGDFSRTNPKTTARAVYGAAFDFAEFKGLNFSVKGGGYKQGNEVGGYGGLGMAFKGLEISGVYGLQNFNDAEVFYPFFKQEKLEVGAFFHTNDMDGVMRVQRAGVKIRFKQ